MRRTLLILLCVVSLVFATAAFAAEQTGTPATAQADHIVKADELAGKTIQDRNSNEIGQVKSIVLDTATGAAYALISLEGKLHPVPITAFKKVQDKYTLNIDRNKLAQSPGFTEDNISQLASKDFDAKVYQFFGVTPPWGSEKKTMK